jgi:hypothetical protein
MKSEDEMLAELKDLLTHRIEVPADYVRGVRGKKLKQEFGKLVRLMGTEDELWEWKWWGPVEPRNRYAFGWCVLRDGVPIASYTHSES